MQDSYMGPTVYKNAFLGGVGLGLNFPIRTDITTFHSTMSLLKSHDSNCLASLALSPVIHASCNHFGTCKRPCAFSSHNLRRRALSLAMCCASSLERMSPRDNRWAFAVCNSLCATLFQSSLHGWAALIHPPPAASTLPHQKVGLVKTQAE